MNVISYKPEHLESLNAQPAQRWVLSVLPPDYLYALGAMGPAASAEVDGRIIACAGVAHIGAWMGTLWAFVGIDAGRHFVRLHKCTERLLSIPPVRRIEATSEVNFLPGCRWLELLGFSPEGIMRAYGVDGADHMRYARVM